MKMIGTIKPRIPSPYTPWIKDVMKETHEERLKRKEKYCSKCFYAVRIAGDSPNQALCNYIEITGHMRGCSPVGCTKFRPGRVKRTRRPDNTLQERKTPVEIEESKLKDVFYEGIYR